MNFEEFHNFTILRESKGSIPTLPFFAYKNHVLGKKYNLSLVFIGTRKATFLYNEYKKKNYPLDILSFPLEDDTGEIIMCLSQLKKKAKEFGRNYPDHIMFMFIHGCLHLAGHTHHNDTDHAIMERDEEKYYTQYLKEKPQIT